MRPQKLGGYDENNSVAVDVKQKLFKFVKQAINNGYEEFWTGMAQGVDQWAAEAVLNHRNEGHQIKLFAAIPFLKQAQAWSRNESAIERWKSIAEQADEIHLVCPKSEIISYEDLICKFENEPTETLPNWMISSWMQKRNEYMTDKADTILGIHDGTAGGTANCIKYARLTNKTVIVYNPVTKVLSKNERI